MRNFERIVYFMCDIKAAHRCDLVFDWGKWEFLINLPGSKLPTEKGY